MTFNFGSAKVCSPAIFETSFSYDKDIWIAATDYYTHFYIIISRRAKAQEGDYEMMPVCACVRALVCHADFSKTTTATDFL